MPKLLKKDSTPLPGQKSSEGSEEVILESSAPDKLKKMLTKLSSEIQEEADYEAKVHEDGGPRPDIFVTLGKGKKNPEFFQLSQVLTISREDETDLQFAKELPKGIVFAFKPMVNSVVFNYWARNVEVYINKELIKVGVNYHLTFNDELKFRNYSIKLTHEMPLTLEGQL